MVGYGCDKAFARELKNQRIGKTMGVNDLHENIANGSFVTVTSNYNYDFKTHELGEHSTVCLGDSGGALFSGNTLIGVTSAVQTLAETSKIGLWASVASRGAKELLETAAFKNAKIRGYEPLQHTTYKISTFELGAVERRERRKEYVKHAAINIAKRDESAEDRNQIATNSTRSKRIQLKINATVNPAIMTKVDAVCNAMKKIQSTDGQTRFAFSYPKLTSLPDGVPMEGFEFAGRNLYYEVTRNNCGMTNLIDRLSQGDKSKIRALQDATGSDVETQLTELGHQGVIRVKLKFPPNFNELEPTSNIEVAIEVIGFQFYERISVL